MTDQVPFEVLDGWVAFVSPLLVLGRPTRDGRTLDAEGSFTLYGEAPLIVGPEMRGFAPEGVMGVIAGLLRRGDTVFAVGVADWGVAMALNDERLNLGADFDALKLKDDPSIIKQGTVRAARLIEPECYAWR